jgi:predicted metal-dependent hydrolase
MSDAVPVDEELLPGVALWKAGRYVEAHEEFEHLWLVEVGPRRHFLRGLVHAAMGFHYLTSGDVISARSKLASASNLLDGFPGDFLGLDVDGVRAGILASRAVLEAGGHNAPMDHGGLAIPHLTPRVTGLDVRTTET